MPEEPLDAGQREDYAEWLGSFDAAQLAQVVDVIDWKLAQARKHLLAALVDAYPLRLGDEFDDLGNVTGKRYRVVRFALEKYEGQWMVRPLVVRLTRAGIPATGPHGRLLVPFLLPRSIDPAKLTGVIHAGNPEAN